MPNGQDSTCRHSTVLLRMSLLRRGSTERSPVNGYNHPVVSGPGPKKSSYLHCLLSSTVKASSCWSVCRIRICLMNVDWAKTTFSYLFLAFRPNASLLVWNLFPVPTRTLPASPQPRSRILIVLFILFLSSRKSESIFLLIWINSSPCWCLE